MSLIIAYIGKKGCVMAAANLKEGLMNWEFL